MTLTDLYLNATSVRRYAVSLLVVFIFLASTWGVLASPADLRIDADTCAVMTIEGDGSFMWVGTTKGLFKWADAPNKLPQQVRVDTGTVYVFLRDGNTLWIGTERGLFRWDDPKGGGTPRLIQGSPDSITRLQRFGKKLLMGAEGGLFMWQDTAPEVVTHLSVSGQFVNTFLNAGDSVWIGSDQGLLLWDKGNEDPTRIPLDRDVEVTSLYKDGETLLVGTSAGLLRWLNAPAGSPEWVFKEDSIYSIYKDGTKVLVSTPMKGLFRVDDVRANRWVPIDNRIGASSKYYRNGSVLWMGAGVAAEATLYRWGTDGGEKPQRLDTINTGFVHSFYRNNDTLWIGAHNGLFRLDGLDTDWDAKLQINNISPKELTTDSTPLISWQVGNFGWRTTPQQAQYRVIVHDAVGDEVKLSGLEVTGQQEVTLSSLPEGKYKLYIEATDLNGKKARSETKDITVAASWKSLLLKWGPRVGIVYGILILLAIILAPYRKFWHELLLNPWLGNIGSFGPIPLSLTVIGPARRHVFKRYLNGVMSEEDFSKWQDRFVMPTDDFLPETFGASLKTDRRIILQGQSGVGKTSYFRYLTRYYAEKRDTPPAGAVPVYIPLARYRSESPEDMFSDQLSNYGLLTDKKLNLRFLEQGGFLIFLDGLNEIAGETRDHIYAFIERHWKANYFCISSQQPHTELVGMKEVRLYPLSNAKVGALLRIRLGDEQAEAIIEQFGDSLSKVYGVPQDLELAVAFKKQHPMSPLPSSKTELYEATFSPIFDEWVEAGQTDYPRLLCKRAYDTLRLEDPFFNDSDAPLPEDLIVPLVNKKYLIQRGDDLMWRHDLVRSYLASKYFGRHWQDVLSDEEVEVNSNWRKMLEFSLLSIEDAEKAKQVLEWILMKNKRLAGDLFFWMESNMPTLISEWAADFTHKFGQAMLRRAGPQ